MLKAAFFVSCLASGIQAIELQSSASAYTELMTYQLRAKTNYGDCTVTADRVKVGGDNLTRMKNTAKSKDKTFTDVTFPDNLSMLIWDDFDDYVGLPPKSKLEQNPMMVSYFNLQVGVG